MSVLEDDDIFAPGRIFAMYKPTSSLPVVRKIIVTSFRPPTKSGKPAAAALKKSKKRKPYPKLTAMIKEGERAARKAGRVS